MNGLGKGFAVDSLPCKCDEKKLTHSHGRECPICRGMCVHTKINSITSYEELEAEILRRRRLEGLSD